MPTLRRTQPVPGDPGQRVWTYKAAESDRKHVLQSIRRDECDLDCATDQRGRPYSLVCTKNQASFEKRVAQRQRDLGDLALLDSRGYSPDET